MTAAERVTGYLLTLTLPREDFASARARRSTAYHIAAAMAAWDVRVSEWHGHTEIHISAETEEDLTVARRCLAIAREGLQGRSGPRVRRSGRVAVPPVEEPLVPHTVDRHLANGIEIASSELPPGDDTAGVQLARVVKRLGADVVLRLMGDGAQATIDLAIEPDPAIACSAADRDALLWAATKLRPLAAAFADTETRFGWTPPWRAPR